MFQEEQDVEKTGKGRWRRMRSKLCFGIPSWHSQETQNPPGNPLAGVFPGNPALLWISQFSWERNCGNLTRKRQGRKWILILKCGKYQSNSKIPGNEGVEFCWELLRGNSTLWDQAAQGILKYSHFSAQLNFSPLSPWSWRDSKASSPNYKIPMKFCPFHTFMPL